MTTERPARVLITSATLLTAVFLGGCNHTTTSSAGGSISLPAVVATVNGTPISQADYITEVMGYQAQPGQPPSSAPTGRIVLAQMIQDQLIEQFAAKANVSPTQSQIDAQYNDLALLHDSQSAQPMDTLLQQSFLTEDQYKRLHLVPQIAQVNLLTQGLSVMDSEKQSYYNINKAQRFTESDRAHIKRIAFATQAQAQSAYNQIKAGAQTFEDFIPQSVVQNPPDADLPNWIPTDAGRNPQIAPLCAAINNTAVGATSAPFSFQHGWWLVKVLDKKPAETLPESQVDHLITMLLLTGKAQDPMRIVKLQQDLKSFESKAQITINIPNCEDIVTNIKSAANAPTPPPAGAPAQ